MLEEDDGKIAAPSLREISITPPEDSELTNEDSAEEYETGLLDIS